MKRLYIQTFSCQMNQHDSERMARVMRRMDYAPTDCVESADLIHLPQRRRGDHEPRGVGAAGGENDGDQRRAHGEASYPASPAARK